MCAWNSECSVGRWVEMMTTMLRDDLDVGREVRRCCWRNRLECQQLWLTIVDGFVHLTSSLAYLLTWNRPSNWKYQWWYKTGGRVIHTFGFLRRRRTRGGLSVVFHDGRLCFASSCSTANGCWLSCSCSAPVAVFHGNCLHFPISRCRLIWQDKTRVC